MMLNTNHAGKYYKDFYRGIIVSIKKFFWWMHFQGKFQGFLSERGMFYTP
jgi:hypothetical protein